MLYKDEHSHNILKTKADNWGIRLSSYKFESGNCPRAWDFSNVGAQPNGGLKVLFSETPWMF